MKSVNVDTFSRDFPLLKYLDSHGLDFSVSQLGDCKLIRW